MTRLALGHPRLRRGVTPNSPPDGRKPTHGPLQESLASGSECVVAAGWASFSVCFRLGLPLGGQTLGTLEPPEGWIDSAAGKTGSLDDVESMTATSRDGRQDQSRRKGKVRFSHETSSIGSMLYVSAFFDA